MGLVLALRFGRRGSFRFNLLLGSKSAVFVAGLSVYLLVLLGHFCRHSINGFISQCRVKQFLVVRFHVPSRARRFVAGRVLPYRCQRAR